MLSIVIPTLNEEKYLPQLLKSIEKQNFKDYEIIVADAHSKDKTVKIAKSFGCKIVRGGLPSKGRNEGAKIAKGDLILFLDADVILPKNALLKIIKEFEERDLDVASFLFSCQEKFHDLSFKIFYNLASQISEKILPQAMSVILVKRKLHKKIGGFDEKIKIGEDLDYVQRGAKIGKFGVIKSVKIFISPRRFKQDGWFKTWLKYFLVQLHMLFFGPVKSDIFKYRFGHYKDGQKREIN